MEKQFEEDQLAARLMKEAGLEKPSLKFSANVMKAINVKQKTTAYKPLMPSIGWIILACIMVFSVIGLYNTNTGLFSFSDINFNLSWTFPTIELSQTMSLAICCMLLFLLQVPFLKGLIERENR